MTTLARQMLRRRGFARTSRGFTLIELLTAVVVAGVLITIALPSMREYVRRGSRQAAQAHLIELATTQDKIFLNSNAYSASVTGAYSGASTGGLGVPGGLTRDGRYTLSVTGDGASFTLAATPVVGSAQDGDGTLTIDSTGARTWGSRSW
ncbi:type IV pilin protein [Sphaerotilus microaerophilus]|uniref:Pilus biosynthesis protein n=1 Tax=Sphaerotilus microaerophilus TaxID=2914710 RepID=A0ABN6PSA4_9BURK|nr:type IV pilin protein [Sphaerotilus sp. FB-5]BDI08060.1 pilus biosynthesis protein [Sphaerotilus sp. FB-5]